MDNRPQLLRLEARQSAGTTIVTVTGEIDISTAPKLQEHLVDCILSGARHVVLDFAGVEFIDSTGLGVVIAAHQQLGPLGGGIEVRNTPSASRRVFEISGVDKVVSVKGPDNDAASLDTPGT